MKDDNDQAILSHLVTETIREQRAKRRWGIFFRLLFFGYVIFLTVALMISGDDRHVGFAEQQENYAAVIQISGAISADGANSANAINRLLGRAFRDPQAVGVILQIDSPGGSAVESNRIYKEIRRLREKYPDKKIYAVAGDFCASGGYFIAAATDEIYADETSFIGSIGVIFSGFGVTGLLENLGIERRVQTAGDNKNMFDIFSPQGEEEKRLIGNLLTDIQEVFIAAVRDGRGDRLVDDPVIYSGAVFSGEESKRLGLIDGYADVGGVARDLIGVERVSYFYEHEWWQDALMRLPSRIATELLRPSVD